MNGERNGERSAELRCGRKLCFFLEDSQVIEVKEASIEKTEGGERREGESEEGLKKD